MTYGKVLYNNALYWSYGAILALELVVLGCIALQIKCLYLFLSNSLMFSLIGVAIFWTFMLWIFVKDIRSMKIAIEDLDIRLGIEQKIFPEEYINE